MVGLEYPLTNNQIEIIVMNMPARWSEMDRGRKRSLAVPLITAFILISIWAASTVFDGSGGQNGGRDNGAFGYSTTKVGIYTAGDSFSTEPAVILDEYNISIEPNLPNGVRMFYNEWEINGRVIDSAGKRSCSISTTAGAICWNQTETGGVQLEVPPSEEASSEPSVFTSISVGGGHSCVIVSFEIKEELACWGSNWNGQLGDGTTINAGNLRFVSNVQGNWTHVTAGNSHTCGVIEFIDIYCWGDGSLGQIGDGNKLDRYNPVFIERLTSDVVSIVAGQYHTCSLTQGGEVKCWGWNGYGQIGDGTFENALDPVIVQFEDGYSAVGVALGGQHSCAILDIQETYCWGDNKNNQISLGHLLELPLPTSIGKEPGASPLAISAGSNHTCVVYREGFSCQGTISGYESMDINPEEIRDISSGSGFLCGVSNSGVVNCFGAIDTSSQLGLPRELISLVVPSSIPKGAIAGTPIENITEVFAIYATAEDLSTPPANASGSVMEANFTLEVDFGQDSDVDGWKDSDEIECRTKTNDATSFPLDFDKDGKCDRLDNDDDNDGAIDNNDAFPNDPYEWRDDDRDGIGKNADSFEFTVGMRSAMFTLSILIVLLIIEMSTLLNEQSGNRGGESEE